MKNMGYLYIIHTMIHQQSIKKTIKSFNDNPEDFLKGFGLALIDNVKNFKKINKETK